VHTEPEIIPFVQKFVPLKPDYIQFRPFQYTSDNPTFSPEAEEFLRLARGYTTPETRVVQSEWRGSVKRGYDRCDGAHFVTKINAEGKVSVCCHWQNDPAFQVGDLSRNTFAEIWKSGKLEEVLDKIDVHACPPLCRYNRNNEDLAYIQWHPGELSRASAGKFDHPNFI
jgi:hypothetical protein